MGIFDKAKDAAGEHPEQVDKGLDKAGDFADEKTGDKYSGQIDKGEDAAGKYLGGDNDKAGDAGKAAPGQGGQQQGGQQ